MGKTLLRSHVRRRKPRRAPSCKRFCSCCGEDQIKPFSRLNSGRNLRRKQEARKFGKTAKGSKRASVEVKLLEKSRKSVKLTQGYSVRAHLKQVIVNVTPLSEDVLKVLSENGSICACNVNTKAVCKLSPSKSGKYSRLGTPTRRLRSTQIQPVVRQNVMDDLRELNADWRSTTCPLSVRPPSKAFVNFQKPEFTMKTLFLENLSICKKTPGDESAKENVKIHRNEKVIDLVNPRREVQQLKSMPVPPPSKVRFVPVPMKVKSQPYIKYRSLLGEPNASTGPQNLRFSPTKHGLNPPPLAPLTRKTIVIPARPLNPHPSSSRLPTSNTNISAISQSSKNESKDDDDDVQIIETLPSSSPRSLKSHQPSSSNKPHQNSKILLAEKPSTQQAHKRTHATDYSKDCASASALNSATMDTKPRIIRRTQSMGTRSGCSDKSTEFPSAPKPDETSLPQEKSRRATGNTPEAGDSCSSPKKQKIASKTSEGSKINPKTKPVMFPSAVCGKPEKSHVLPPVKPQGFYTIVLSDSSDEEPPVKKTAPARPITPAAKKCTPIRRSARKISKRQAASKAVSLKKTSLPLLGRNKSSYGHSNGSINSLPNKPLAVNRVPPRKNSIVKRNSRNVVSDSDSESEELSTDSEEEAPRYVSRTGRSVGISTGCRSCPGCKVDRPKKDKPKLKPTRKKRKPEPMVANPHEDSNASDSDFYTDVVYAGLEELVEDASQKLESPAVVMHGLTSSESSDEELLVLKGGRTALVVVPDDSDGDHKESPPRSEVAEEVTRRRVRSPVPGGSGNTVKTVSKPTTDSEGPDLIGLDADVPVKFSEGPASSRNPIPRMKQLLNEKLLSKPSASASTPILQTPENSEVLTGALSSAVTIKHDTVGGEAACSQVSLNTKPCETQNVETGMDDQGTDGLSKSPYTASDVQCYLSQVDSSGTRLLHEINSESSEADDTLRENTEPGCRGNGNFASIGDSVSIPLLVDNSSEISDGSSAVLNFDSQEYTECGSTCSSVHEDSCQEASVEPEGCGSENCGSENCNVDSSSLGDELCSARPGIEGDLQRKKDLSEDSTIAQGTPKSNKPDGFPFNTQEDKVAAGSQAFEGDSASEHGPVPSRVTEIFSETWDCQTQEESPLDALRPGDMKKPQGDVRSKVPHSEMGDSVDQDGHNTSKYQDSTHDTTTSLADTALLGNTPHGEREPTDLESITQGVSTLPRESMGDSSLPLVLQSDGTGKIDEQDCGSGDAGHQDSSQQNSVQNCVPPESCHSSRDKSASPPDAVFGSTQLSQESSTIILDVSDTQQNSPDKSEPKSGTLLQNETSETRCMELYVDNPDCQDPSIDNQAPPERPSSRGDSLECGVAQAHGCCLPESGAILQNETSDTRSVDQDCLGGSQVLEIHLLEGCPSCQGDDRKSSLAKEGHIGREEWVIHAKNPDCEAPESSSGDPPECPSSPGDLPKYGVPQPHGGTFYHAVSNLLIDCLNNMVESVKLDNREVVIKKVNGLEADPASPYRSNQPIEEAGLAAEDLASILRELNLPVSLNPRLTIKKLPPVPREGNSACEVNSASQDSTSQESPSDHSTDHDHQVPENVCTGTNITPSKSIYERKGYPTPIKRLDPRVLSVIKYNDLEIYNDEPSLNDPPESDRVECVSSRGVRLELNPEELANIENLLNTKISHLRDKGMKSSDEGGVKSFEIDELVIYNDEPALNCTPVKCLTNRPPLLEDEDPEELVIDNDAPPLNEPFLEASRRNEPLEASPPSDPVLPDPECMVISSDDEVMTTSGPVKDAPQPEAISTLQIASDKPSKPVERPRKKLFRKRRNSRNTVEASSIIDLQRSQWTFREEDPYDFGAGNQQLDLSELYCPSEDIIDELVIDDGGVETFHQSSWKPLPPFDSCREVLHQPQVFNHQGQPLLNLGPSGHDIDHNLANSQGTSSSKNVCSTSQVMFDLSETFRESQEIERMHVSDSDTVTASEYEGQVIVVSPPKTEVTDCMNISDSDTLTASECEDQVIVVSPPKTEVTECMNISDSDQSELTTPEREDEVIVVSPPKTSSTHVGRFIEMHKNGCDRGLIQSVDSDSDDDVIVMSGPDKVRPVNNRFRNPPLPAAPPPVQRLVLPYARGRKAAFSQSNASPQIHRNLPAPFTTGQVRTVQTPSGHSYIVLVVPPKTLEVNPRR